MATRWAKFKDSGLIETGNGPIALPTAFEQALEADLQSPVIWADEFGLFALLRTTKYLDPQEVIELGDLSFAATSYLFSAVSRNDPAGTLEPNFWPNGASQTSDQTATSYFAQAISNVISGYESAIDGLRNDIREVEESLFSEETGDPTQRIYLLKRESVDFERAVLPMQTSLRRTVAATGHISDEERPQFQHLQARLDDVCQQLGAIRELLASALQAHLAQVSIQQNNDMRKISAWVAIAAVPTMFAGIYGMNFEHMPELTWRYGYPAALSGMFVVCGFLYWRFKRANWL